jgi:hypothetical protein
LPLPLEQRARYGAVLAAVVDRLRGGSERSVFLDMEQLHQNNAVREISRNGAQWAPEMGMGMEPGAAPPKLWTFAELSERDVTQPMPPLIRNVCHLEGEERARVHAAQTMCGTGGLVQVMHRVAIDQVLQAWSHNALLRIEEEALRAFPIYLPLLSGRALQKVSEEEMTAWLGPVDAYLRESMEDRGLLIVARQAPEIFLRDTGILLPRDLAGQDGDYQRV